MRKWVLALSLLCLSSISFAQSTPDMVSAQPEAPQAEASVQTDKSSQKMTFSLNADTEAFQLTDDIRVTKAQMKKYPDDPEANFLLAAAYSRSPYLDKAFKQIKKTKELLKAKKDFEFIDRTIAQYENILETRPDDQAVLFRLGFGYFFKGYSLEKYPHHYKNGPTGNANDYYNKAVETMRTLVNVNPKDTWARNYMGYFMTENGKNLGSAIQVWEDSLAIDSATNPGAYLLLSQAYLKQGDLAKSLAYGAKGLEIQQTMGMRIP